MLHMLSICSIYALLAIYNTSCARYLYMLSICLAYPFANKPFYYRDIFRVGVYLLQDLIAAYVHMFGICTAYSVYAVAKGKLWLLMRVLYG